MQTIDAIILAGSFLLAIVAVDPAAFTSRKVKVKQLETCRCFYCK